MTDDPKRHLSKLVDDGVPGVVPPFSDVVLRRRRRRTTRIAIVASVAAVAAVSIGVPTVLAGRPTSDPSPAPATQSPSDPTDPTTSVRPDPQYEWGDGPSPVVLRLADRDIKLDPWTYCWNGPPDAGGGGSGACVDGFAPDESLEDIGDPATVDVWFGRPGWWLDFTFQELGVRCAHSFTVRADATGLQTFQVAPAGPAARYRVDVFGRGPEGDVATSFIWDTPTDGPVDPPRGTIALVADGGDALTSYGLEVSIQDLAEQPETAGVEVTATAANGRSMTLTAPWRKDRGGCYDRGSLFFDDSDPSGVEDLGPAPYTYKVVLTLDGEEYVGNAVWPRDETKHEAPYTLLTFDPPLPAYTID